MPRATHPPSLSATLSVLAVLDWLAACAGRGGPDPPSADLRLHNARIVTTDEATPEAEAIAIRGDPVVGVGTRGEFEAFVGTDEGPDELDVVVGTAPRVTRVD